MTLAAITMTAPEAASPLQMYRATYSPDDNKLRLYSFACLMTLGRREDKCPSARAGKRPRAGGAERGRADAPPLTLRGHSAVGFCLFRPVICLLLMMLLFLLLFFFFLLL